MARPAVPPPPISRELVAWLESLFPDRLPDELVAHRELDRLIGRQDVVRRLRRELEGQTNNLLR